MNAPWLENRTNHPALQVSTTTRARRAELAVKHRELMEKYDNLPLKPISKPVPQPPRWCMTCRHGREPVHKEPCESCFSNPTVSPGWEPKRKP